ncbi:Rep family protein [Streptococcus suis]|uniref:Rep family protein n=1 Tax=Streptococcus suis TaxID=1307 RepID=UPI000CF49B83|nr:Rep family protein [Streptococcus suis]
MTRKKSSRTVDKSTYFTFLMYPESIPDDWNIQLQTLGRPIAISPLHDKDPIEKKTAERAIKDIKYYMQDNSLNIGSHEKATLNERIAKYQEVIDGIGTIFKKEHYHAIYVAKNPVTADSVRKKLQSVLGVDAVGLVQIVSTSVRNVYEYLTHESVDAVAKKKHVYPKSEIQLLNGFDIDRYDVLDSAEKKEYYYKILDIIRDYEIPNIIDLEYFIADNEQKFGISVDVLREVVENKTGMMRAYFDGSYQRSKRKRLEDDNKLKEENEELWKVLKQRSEENAVLKTKLKDEKKEEC